MGDRARGCQDVDSVAGFLSLYQPVRLELSPKNSFQMMATQPIPKSHEIINMFGQMANWQLIRMFGFVELCPDNTDGTSDIQMVPVCKAR